MGQLSRGNGPRPQEIKPKRRSPGTLTDEERRAQNRLNSAKRREQYKLQGLDSLGRPIDQSKRHMSPEARERISKARKAYFANKRKEAQ